MTRQHAQRGIGLLATALLLVAGCSLPDNDDEQAEARVHDRLISRLEALSGADVTATIESGLDAGQNNVEVIGEVPATATTPQLNTLADRIERTIWLSRLDPMGRIGIDLVHEGTTTVVLERLYTSRLDTGPLRAKFGPRPDGLSG